MASAEDEDLSRKNTLGYFQRFVLLGTHSHCILLWCLVAVHGVCCIRRCPARAMVD